MSAASGFKKRSGDEDKKDEGEKKNKRVLRSRVARSLRDVNSEPETGSAPETEKTSENEDEKTSDDEHNEGEKQLNPRNPDGPPDDSGWEYHIVVEGGTVASWSFVPAPTPNSMKRRDDINTAPSSEEPKHDHDDENNLNPRSTNGFGDKLLHDLEQEIIQDVTKTIIEQTTHRVLPDVLPPSAVGETMLDNNKVKRDWRNPGYVPPQSQKVEALPQQVKTVNLGENYGTEGLHKVQGTVHLADGRVSFLSSSLFPLHPS